LTSETLTVHSRLANQVSVEFGINANLGVIHAVHLESRKSDMSSLKKLLLLRRLKIKSQQQLWSSDEFINVPGQDIFVCDDCSAQDTGNIQVNRFTFTAFGRRVYPKQRYI